MNEVKETAWVRPARLAWNYAKGVAYALRGGRVSRYHTLPRIVPQNVAEHSYGVAWYCWALSGCTPSAELLMAALVHDVAEYTTGDIPAMTKRLLNGALDEVETTALKANGLGTVGLGLTPAEKQILKLADLLDGWRYSIDEVRRGNFEMRVAAFNYEALVRRYPLGEELKVWATPFIHTLRRDHDQYVER